MTLGTDREKWWRMEKRGGKDRKREGGKANERERKLLTPHTHATIRRLTGPARCTRGEERARHVTQARALLHDWHRHYHTILLPPTHTHPTHKRAHTHTRSQHAVKAAPCPDQSPTGGGQGSDPSPRGLGAISTEGAMRRAKSGWSVSWRTTKKCGREAWSIDPPSA